MPKKNYIVNLILKTSQSSPVFRVFFTALGMTIFFSIMTLFVIAGLWIDRMLGWGGHAIGLTNVLLSAPLICAGLILMAWTAAHFFWVKGSPVPLNPPPRLVERGLYAYSRNPMMIGVFIFLFGLGILLYSIGLTLIVTPGLIVLGSWYLKRVEEVELEERLGQVYLDYKKRVPMYWPKFPTRSGE